MLSIRLGCPKIIHHPDPISLLISTFGIHLEPGCKSHGQIVHFRTAKNVPKQATVLLCFQTNWGIACWLERRSRDPKVASSNPAGAAGELSSPESAVLTLVWCPLHPQVTAVACKRPRHSAKSAGGRLHLNTHTPLTQ